jgi:hypothetical protein
MYHYSGEDGREHWRLLCICSEQTSFCKSDVRAYSTNPKALQVGWAVQGQWQSSTRGSVALVNDLLRRKIEDRRHTV